LRVWIYGRLLDAEQNLGNEDVRYHPQLISIICNSIKVLASGASQRLASTATDVLLGDVKVISEVSVKLLPTLFKMVEQLTTASVLKKSSEESSMIKEFDRENEQHMDLMVQMTGEVFLCLKDANGKARDLAYEILLSMARVFNDMNAFFPVVLGALAAKTAHMRSAAVMALSRLVFEYARHDETVQALLPSLLTTVLVLFDEKARELIKSVVGFVRVAVAAMSREQLEPILSDVVAGLFKFGRGKDRFRAKIKIILKKLVRLFGYEKITDAALMIDDNVNPSVDDDEEADDSENEQIKSGSKRRRVSKFESAKEAK
jgi:hypothetical protein